MTFVSYSFALLLLTQTLTILAFSDDISAFLSQSDPSTEMESFSRGGTHVSSSSHAEGKGDIVTTHTKTTISTSSSSYDFSSYFDDRGAFETKSSQVSYHAEEETPGTIKEETTVKTIGYTEPIDESSMKSWFSFDDDDDFNQ
eukprot:g7394.t1